MKEHMRFCLATVAIFMAVSLGARDAASNEPEASTRSRYLME